MASRAWRRNRWIWKIAPPFEGAEDLAHRLGTHPLIAQILANRGITDLQAARAFLNPALTDLHDPDLLPGIRDAAELIVRTVHERRPIVIYGDYDVDGITGVAILHACLRMFDAQVQFYVPHRLDEGYGVNTDAIRTIVEQGAKLLITVDCGISASGPLSEAVEAGLDVIVTDHHSPPHELPKVSGIVHPRLGEGTYPNPDLSGAGVAFKLAWQIARVMCGKERLDEPMRDFLLNSTGLAALGTIADVVPLVGENRSLAVHGLRGLPAATHPGIQALLESAGLANGKLDAYDVGFVLGPRINACGRMGHARLAVELLTDASPTRCKEIAAYLAKQNSQRQRIQREVTRQAIEMVKERGLDGGDHQAIVLWSDDWHGGVVGIVASRLVDEFSRPTVLLAINGDGGVQGSGRSTSGFHMRDALAECSEHLIGFGGHAKAGGVRLERDKIAPFAEAFEQCARANISSEQLTPALAIDAETRLSALDFNLAEHMVRLGPFGEGNPSPIVAVHALRVLVPPKRMGRNGGTVGLLLGEGDARIRAVGFGMGDLADDLAGIDTIDVTGQVILNTFNGRTSVELKLKDVKWD
jgi:single-stranded-DNA-specific exonuclease